MSEGREETYHGKPMKVVPWKPTKEDIQKEVKAIKEEISKLKERLGTRRRPQTFIEAVQPAPIEMLKEDLQSLKEKVEGKKSTKKETLPSPPSEIILPSN